MNIIEQLEKDQVERLGASVPEFAPGATLRVSIKVVERRARAGAGFRKGVCIARKKPGPQLVVSRVRKLSYGEGVGAHLPTALARRSQASRSCATAMCGAPSFTTCAAAPVSAPVLLKSATTGGQAAAAAKADSASE